MLESMIDRGGQTMGAFSWQQSYRDALLELNPAELRAKIARAVAELERRSQELMFAQGEEAVAERQAVADALNGLGAIQRHELTTTLGTSGQTRSIIE